MSAALVKLGHTDGRLSGEEMLFSSSLVRIYLNAHAMQAMARSLVLCSMQGQPRLDRESLVFTLVFTAGFHLVLQPRQSAAS